jgi:hypothetical protein
MLNLQFIQKIGRSVNKASRKGVPQNDAVGRQKKEGTPSFFFEVSLRMELIRLCG